jgi:hypothetical protein
VAPYDWLMRRCCIFALQTTPWMHEDRWQQRAGTWQKRVPDGTARGAQGQGLGQGCRQDGTWEGFRLPLDNSGSAHEPPEKAMYRPPTWGRRNQLPPGSRGGSAEVSSLPQTALTSVLSVVLFICHYGHISHAWELKW